MMNLNDPSNIVPRAIPQGSYVVRPFDFAVRTIVDHDINFMQDRVHSQIFVNGRAVGIYAALRVGDERQPIAPMELIERYGPDLESSVIDEFMGLGYRKKVQVLEGIVRDLQDYIERDRWWQFNGARRAWANFRLRIAPSKETS